MFVRLGLESDEDTIVELTRMNVEETVPDVGFNPDKVRQVYRKYIATANPTIFVVEDRREVIAFLLATMSEYRFTDGLYTTQEVLFVRPDKRGTRAAVILVKQLIAWSEALGAKEITGGNDNSFQSERTAKFLEHFGFKNVGFFMRRVTAHNGEKG